MMIRTGSYWWGIGRARLVLWAVTIGLTLCWTVGGALAFGPPGTAAPSAAGDSSAEGPRVLLGGGEYEDDFESYPLGEICGQNGWEEWDGSSDVCGSVVEDESFDGFQSLEIVGATGPAGDDTVQRFDIEGGVWPFRIMTYVPRDAVGDASIILLNSYPPALGNASWSVVIALDATSGNVEDWVDIPLADLVFGHWVEFRLEIDLDADTVDYYYDGELILAAQSWKNKIANGGTPRIEALDLYGGEPTGSGTTGTYFDTIVLGKPVGGCVRDPEWQCDGDVDGDGQVNPVDSGLVQARFGSVEEQDLCNYDVDCDGQINPVDSGIVQSLFGTCEEPRGVCP